MKEINKIVFITGTRADYGKLKSLIRQCENNFKTYLYVSGMHLLEQYGSTYKDILKDGYDNIFCAQDALPTGKMDIDLANTIISLNKYLHEIEPDMIVIHGDRIDALAGATSGMLNNIPIAHVEGGEVTGTVDEAIRHSISKMAQIHFVANYESKLRIKQLGEKEKDIHVIGSPDIDIMLSELPSLEVVKDKYSIDFEEYGILIYHPVTTEKDIIDEHIEKIMEATRLSKKKYIVIYPNNDLGSESIIRELEKIQMDRNYKVFQSIPFEEFLVLLKNADFIIGNSSAGIREACIYGVPAIDVGTRQQGRYQKRILQNIQHVDEDVHKIVSSIKNVDGFRIVSDYYGNGRSAESFIDILKSYTTVSIQKKFIDTKETRNEIENYINEVCF